MEALNNLHDDIYIDNIDIDIGPVAVGGELVLAVPQAGVAAVRCGALEGDVLLQVVRALVLVVEDSS